LPTTNLEVPKRTHRTVTDLISLVRQARGGKNGLAHIAAAIDKSYSWVTKFSCGLIPDPTISTVQALSDYFDAMDADDLDQQALPAALSKKSAGAAR
jgi:hypothetical protein